VSEKKWDWKLLLWVPVGLGLWLWFSAGWETMNSIPRIADSLERIATALEKHP